MTEIFAHGDPLLERYPMFRHRERCRKIVEGTAMVLAEGEASKSLPCDTGARDHVSRRSPPA